MWAWNQTRLKPAKLECFVSRTSSWLWVVHACVSVLCSAALDLPVLLLVQQWIDKDLLPLGRRKPRCCSGHGGGESVAGDVSSALCSVDFYTASRVTDRSRDCGVNTRWSPVQRHRRRWRCSTPEAPRMTSFFGLATACGFFRADGLDLGGRTAAALRATGKDGTGRMA